VNQWLASGWQQRGPLNAVLLPVAFVFALAVRLRRLAYRMGWCTAGKLPVPVVVVGNITAGGSGKTPLTIHLARSLAGRGWRPGIVSRGYGGRARGVEAVSVSSEAALVGDEPLLLARRSGCPVFVGRDRVAAARALLAAYPDCDVLISDDGLQHLRLARDVEIVVLDERGIGNGWPLPAGPLRECPSRIDEAHALVLNGAALPPPGVRPRCQFRMRLSGSRFYNLHDAQRICAAEDLRGRTLRALAGIGQPGRFFSQLEGLGLRVRTQQAFPDHHAFQPSDLVLQDADALLMTEKDAVKCEAIAPPETWVLPVEAQLEPDLTQWVVEKLNGFPPA